MTTVRTLVGFARTLRAAGVAAGPERVASMVAALGHLSVDDPSQVYWAGRLTLCAGPDDLRRYDRCFCAYFSGEAPRQATRPAATTVVPRPVPARSPGSARGEGEEPPEATLAAASTTEVLRRRDLARLGADERARVFHLIALLRVRAPRRTSRRFGAATSGRVDPRATVAAILRDGGEMSRLRRRRRRERPRRVVLLVDVSGSMSPYADALLRFAHAVLRAGPRTAEAFSVGTRLTRLTRELAHRDADTAMSAASEAIPDWSGGTRLGEELKEFLDRFGQRGLARGAVVVIASDGWERGDAGLLGDQMARLHRLAHRVVWANPHKARPGFRPLTAGLVAALPHVDAFVAGHSLGALEELAALIGSTRREVIAGA